MNPNIAKIIENINKGIIPEGYKKTKVGIVPVEWDVIKAKEVFVNITNKKHGGQLEILSVTQNRGIIPRSQVDIDIKYEKENTLNYKKVEKGNFVISLRSFQGGIEYSEYEGIVSPAYTVLSSKVEICNNYYKVFFKSPEYIQRLNTAVYGIRDGKNISYDDFSLIYIPFPPLPEQQKIAEILSTQDKLIELYERKIEQLKTLKKGYLQKMFPKKGCKYPELRFKGFTDDWEQRKLGEIMNITSVKRIHQSDWTYSGVRFLRARDIVAAYKNEKSSDYLYISQDKYEEYSSLCGKVNKGDLLVTGVGTIGVPMLINDENPLYFKDGNIIWFQNENKINANFLYYSFIGNAIQSFIQESAGTGTVGTYTIDSGKKTPIALPKYMTEQHQIGAFFANLDRLITLHQHKLDKEKQKKKALMQLLLTGKVRVST